MASDYQEKRASTFQEVDLGRREAKKASDISFFEDGKADLFCCSIRQHDTSTSEAAGKWYNHSESKQFLHRISSQGGPTIDNEQDGLLENPSFTLIGGYGNGTIHKFSVDCELFEQIIATLKLPSRIRGAVRSIHGTCGRFVETRADKKSLLVLFSTPKAPVREILCAVRYDLATSSLTCLIFDALRPDLVQIVDAILRSSPSKLVRENPLALMTIIIQQCGFTSENKRQGLDSNILSAEFMTGSTPWNDPNIAVVQKPNNFFEATSVLHLSYNNLIFVHHAINFEVNTWKHLRTMADDQRIKPLLKARASDDEWHSILDEMDFELGHTTCRRGQVDCLKERTTVQIDVMNNLIAHQTTSQTNLIALLALIFAPASLTASIFSAGIFEINERSWVSYVASTIPVTFTTVAVGLIFLERQKIGQALLVLRGVTKEIGKETVPGNIRSV